MSTFDLVVQGSRVGAPDLEALRSLSRASAVERGSGGEFRILGADPAARANVAERCATARLDWGFVARGSRLADFGLLALDMDSTLITVECIDEIADFAGRKAEVSAITAAAMRGEIDWAQSLHRRVAALVGLEAGVLDRVYRERLELTAGARELLDAAHRCGTRTLLVSGGFTCFTDLLRDRLGIGEAHANVLVVEDGRLAGRVSGPLVDAAGKARHVARLRRSLGLPKERVLVIGDGANDLAMMEEAGTSIAFHAKPIVRDRATFALSHVGLEGVLGLFPA
ncbi:MAG: phosphoserine phosphatase SerB [Betaproteobacteria bacterium]|nr:phosphoserine phosphatase SerB [Betaproteobacteria bacterium]